MKRLALFAMLALASFSLGKGWVQPWTPRLPAWESVVYSCDYPKPYRLAAADDFIFEDFTLPINNINWWGVVSDPDQLKRTYHIVIYKESGKCLPAFDSIVWQGCIRPDDAALQGADCQGNRVFKFFSTVPFWNPLTLGPGHYWVQISESDKDSVTPDKPDFWWSSHQPVVKCPALQWDSSFNIIQPLIDPCNQRKDDLAFEILG
jgi:hypothetical protein